LRRRGRRKFCPDCHPNRNRDRLKIEVSPPQSRHYHPSSRKRWDSSDIAFELTPQDGERIRWYLEDYLQFDEDPAPQIAKGVEAFMATAATGCFAACLRSRTRASSFGQ
jgi:hypothetical protein